MPYTPIVATLGYVLSPDRRSVLLIHRNTRPDDQHYGKYNGLGGKIEIDEDVAAGMQRELREEAGIEASALRLRGTVNWPGFGKHGEHWLGFIFTITGWTGVPLARNQEGELVWVPVERVLAACEAETRPGASPYTADDIVEMRRGASLPMWPGDRFFLPLVLGDDPRQFHGVMPYENGQPVSWSYTWA